MTPADREAFEQWKARSNIYNYVDDDSGAEQIAEETWAAACLYAREPLEREIERILTAEGELVASHAKEVNDIRKRIVELEAALKIYGLHRCDPICGYFVDDSSEDCDCGLTEALRGKA